MLSRRPPAPVCSQWLSRPQQSQSSTSTEPSTGTAAFSCSPAWLAASYGPSQYLTTGMAPSPGGDSGAPASVGRGDGHAQMIVVGLAGRTSADGEGYDRFASLADAFDALGLESPQSTALWAHPLSFGCPSGSAMIAGVGTFIGTIRERYHDSVSTDTK